MQRKILDITVQEGVYVLVLVCGLSLPVQKRPYYYSNPALENTHDNVIILLKARSWEQKAKLIVVFSDSGGLFLKITARARKEI